MVRLVWLLLIVILATPKGMAQNAEAKATAKMLKHIGREKGEGDGVINFKNLWPGVELPKNGKLKPEDVQRITQVLVNARVLKIPKELVEPDCLHVEPLTERGFFTGQLFGITYRSACLPGVQAGGQDDFLPLYVLKETKNWGRENDHFKKINNSSLTAEKVVTRELLKNYHKSPENDLPRIAFSDATIVLSTSKKDRYFSFMQMARGKSIHDYLVGLGVSLYLDRTDKEKRLEQARRMFRSLGRSSANLHIKYQWNRYPRPNNGQLLPTSMAHGDFHASNIFYNAESDEVSFIDIETFAFSIEEPVVGASDLTDFYWLHTNKTVARAVSPQLKVHHEYLIPDQEWHDLWHHLLLGYLEAFDKIKTREERIQLFAELKNQFLNPPRSSHSRWDQRSLKLISFETIFPEGKRKKRLKTLFNGLEISYLGASIPNLNAPDRDLPKP
jgi:hypothetical protein